MHTSVSTCLICLVTSSAGDRMHLHGSNVQHQIMGSTSSMFFGDDVEAFRDASFRNSEMPADKISMSPDKANPERDSWHQLTCTSYRPTSIGAIVKFSKISPAASRLFQNRHQPNLNLHTSTYALARPRQQLSQEILAHHKLNHQQHAVHPQEAQAVGHGRH